MMSVLGKILLCQITIMPNDIIDLSLEEETYIEIVIKSPDPQDLIPALLLIHVQSNICKFGVIQALGMVKRHH